MHEVPLWETSNSSNSKILSNMLDMMEQKRKMLQEISKAIPPKEEVMHDVTNLDLDDPCTIIDHPELENNSQ